MILNTPSVVRRGRWWRHCCLAAVALAPVACGPGFGSVAGTVRFQGKAVSSGTVLLVGSDGLPLYGNIQTDGSYAIKRVPVGPAKLAVNSPDPAQAQQLPKKDDRLNDLLPPERRKQVLTRQAAPEKPPAAKPSGWFRLPVQYGDPHASGLTAEVKPGKNALELVLK